jgi:hypothetical protein
MSQTLRVGEDAAVVQVAELTRRILDFKGAYTALSCLLARLLC